MNAEMIGGTGMEGLTEDQIRVLQGMMLDPQQQQAMQQMQMAEALRQQSQQADPGSWTRTGAGTPSIYSANPLGPVAQVAQGYMGRRERRAGEQAMRDISQAEMGIAGEQAAQYQRRAGQGIAATQGGGSPQPAPWSGQQQPLRNPGIMGGGFGGMLGRGLGGR